MPIRPENRDRYPKNWHWIRESILIRAKNRCEECGVLNHEWGARDETGFFHRLPDAMQLYGTEIKLKNPKIIRIVLTIAHLDHTPENCDPDNLRAWCQRCHNRYDAQHRRETRKKHCHTP